MDYSKDPIYLLCLEDIKLFFNDHTNSVFYSRQIEVRFEHKYFHWITNRALRELAETRIVQSETRELGFGELLVVEGLYRNKFKLISEEAKEFNVKVWEKTGNDLDFIFKKDQKYYGVEVKNTLFIYG